jgi:polysaccharide deacetylase family protein (PEP-CTERM system associated)
VCAALALNARNELKTPDHKTAQMTHVLSVDVEDYFQVEAFASSVDRECWDQWPSRVVANTQRVLDLFDDYNAKATFFFVGWVAARFPHLVREVQSRGHELACHSYWHRTVYSLTPEEFRKDTQLAKHVIEDATGVGVIGYRAPSWSITKACLWALDILAEEGFAYDSSIYPIHHDLYGVPGAQRFPYTHACANGQELREFPPATLRVFGTNFPAAGGGYLRIFPSAFTELAFRTFENEYRKPLVVYLHPWEVDPGQPRINGSMKSRLRHYTNLGRMHAKRESVLRRHKFQPFQDVLAAEALEQQSSRHASGMVLDQHQNRPVHAIAETGKG